MLQRYLDLVYQFFKNSYNYCSKYIVFPGYLHLDFLLNLSSSVLYKIEFGHFSVLGDVDVSDVQHGNFDGIPETVVLDNRLQHAKRDLGKQGRKGSQHMVFMVHSLMGLTKISGSVVLSCE